MVHRPGRPSRTRGRRKRSRGMWKAPVARPPGDGQRDRPRVGALRRRHNRTRERSEPSMDRMMGWSCPYTSPDANCKFPADANATATAATGRYQRPVRGAPARHARSWWKRSHRVRGHRRRQHRCCHAATGSRFCSSPLKQPPCSCRGEAERMGTRMLTTRKRIW